MRSGAFVVLFAVLLPATAMAIATTGVGGAGAVLAVGLALASVAALLVRGDEVGARTPAAARRLADARFLVVLVVAGFVVRAVLALGLRALDLNLVLGGDEGTFDANARVFHAWLEGRLPEPFQEKWQHSSQVGYFVFVGSLYWVLGVVPLVPVLLNCIIGALTAIPVYRIAARIGGRLAGRWAAVLIVFFPSLVLWSSLLVRDAPALFLIAWAAALGQDLLRRVSLAKALTLIACLGVLATLRSYIFLLLAAALVGAFLIAAVRRPGRALAVAVLATLGILLLVRGAGLGEEFLAEDYLVRIDHQRRLNALVGNAAIEMGAHDISTPAGALVYLPTGLAYFLLAPFPWQLGGRQALALPDLLVWYACLPLVVMGAIWAYRRRRVPALVPLLAGISICLLYALVEGNVGIIVRHRAQALVLLLPYAGVQVARLVRRLRRRAAVTAALAAHSARLRSERLAGAA